MKSYGFLHLSSLSPKRLTYDGLCSHNSLAGTFSNAISVETAIGDLDAKNQAKGEENRLAKNANDKLRHATNSAHE
jgi:hypothetical protein